MRARPANTPAGLACNRHARPRPGQRARNHVSHGAAEPAACPWAQVLDALHDIVFAPLFLESRIDKERRAVLSEGQMMNTIEYRVDCQLLTHVRGPAPRLPSKSASTARSRSARPVPAGRLNDGTDCER